MNHILKVMFECKQIYL